jgi:hypothetical protein
MDRSGSNWQAGSGQNGAQQCPLWGKKADIGERLDDIRFTPKADVALSFPSVAHQNKILSPRNKNTETKRL